MMRRGLVSSAAFLTMVALPAAALAWAPLDSSYSRWFETVSWQINSGGSATLSSSVVSSTLASSYAAWSAPACSDFASTGGSTTSRSSTSNGDGYNVHGFLSGWPAGYGDVTSTIGITLTSTYPTEGQIIEADVSFNEAYWTFVIGAPTAWRQADLASIATHEYGHSLGLGHSRVPGATMAASYDGGTGAATLSSDDIDGVCSLYPSGIGDDDDATPGDDDDTPGDDDDAVSDCPVDRVASCGSSYSDSTDGRGNTFSNWPACAGDGGWTGPEYIYELTPGSSGPLTVSVSWADASEDLDLMILQGSCDAGGVCLGGSWGYDTTETLTISAAAGETLFVVVDGWEGGEADFDISFSCGGGPPPGDDDDDDDDTPGGGDCDDATSIGCGDELRGDNRGVASTWDQWAVCGIEWPNDGGEVFYEFIPSASGPAEVTLVGDDAAGQDLDVFALGSCNLESGPCLGAGVEVGGNESFELDVTSGVPVYLVVDGYDGGADTFTLSVSCSGSGDDDDDATPGDDDDDATPGDDDDATPGDDDDATPGDDDDATSGDDDDATGDDDDATGDDDDDDDDGTPEVRSQCGCATSAAPAQGGAGLLLLVGLLGISRRRVR